MRSVLLRFVFDRTWAFESLGNELYVGTGWLLTVWLAVAAVSLTFTWRRTKRVGETLAAALFWCILPAAVLLVPRVVPSVLANGVPVFGYGFMLCAGFVAGTLLAVRHARKAGQNPQLIWDLMLWLLIPGIVGARLFYVIQYSDRVFAGRSGLQVIAKLFAVADGGLVFYGSVIGGVVGGLLFCRRKKIRPLLLGDIVAPSLFVGVGFGRIGCFLYGCCYGGACSLPWAVRFPPGSLTYRAQLQDGIIEAGAVSTTALHPAQIYSSLMGFCVAGVMIWLFERRPFEGFLTGLTFVIYPVVRFILEWIRNDEMGQLGTGLTISQLISIALFVGGITLLVRLSSRRQTVAR